jgi:hypothetical protein
MEPVDAGWEDLRQDIPATLASYVLKHGIGKKSSNPVSHVPHNWAKGFIPNLRRAMIQVTKTYGVTPLGLGLLQCVMVRRVASMQVGHTYLRKSTSPNRHTSNPMGALEVWVLVPDSPEKAREIDHTNGNNLWGDAMFIEVQSQIA